MLNIVGEIMIRYIGLIFLWLAPSVCAAHPVVNVFIWSNYIPDSVIHAFEKQTGIQVNISEFDSNEDMYAKLKADPRVQKVKLDIIHQTEGLH